MIAKKGCNGDQKSSVHCIDSQSMGAAGGPDGKCTVAIGGILEGQWPLQEIMTFLARWEKRGA